MIMHAMHFRVPPQQLDCIMTHTLLSLMDFCLYYLEEGDEYRDETARNPNTGLCFCITRPSLHMQETIFGACSTGPQRAYAQLLT